MMIACNNKPLLLLPTQVGSKPALLLLDERRPFRLVHHKISRQMNGKINGDLQISTDVPVGSREHSQPWQNPKRLIPIVVKQSNTMLNARGFVLQVL